MQQGIDRKEALPMEHNKGFSLAELVQGGFV